MVEAKKLLTISVLCSSRQTDDSFPSPKKLKRAVERGHNLLVQPIFFSSDRSTLSSTPGTRRGCPSFPRLDSCLHSHLSVLLLRQERAANSRRLRYRQTVDTCSHSIASRCGLDWTSVCIQSELTCWPVEHRGLSPHFHVISSFQCVPIISRWSTRLRSLAQSCRFALAFIHTQSPLAGTVKLTFTLPLDSRTCVCGCQQ